MAGSQFWMLYGLLAARYVVIAGLAFLVFYFFFSSRFSKLKIQALFPKRKDYVREVAYSFLTFFTFALVGVVLSSSAVLPYTQIYQDVSDYGWGYMLLSVVLALLIHDAYFYWTHRLMHHPRLFKLFHLTHHRSVNPSPWAAFAFSPLEAVVEAGVILVIAFLIPIHPLGILLFLLFMTVYNVYGHLGYEIYPKWVVNSRFGRWLNTSTNHNMHHKYFKGNYGLYFRFWDELLGTTHPHYEKTLAKLVSPEQEQQTSQSS
ncbi:fatty acid hydroxylase family protein [Pontibacter diazotrophicus]|uniref:Fatty acid hydroxylase family protein n=1 Tax=Pontibacter diazotrophicus TaxID=1400979 RepID=A0A3D8LDK9_9BACT|nr:sterol desaturase family protein [Pontibacter diazotrophicus]RDV15549.1 fatty acid hydroxylase family protein [Pontibacter diazotrophicus]